MLPDVATSLEADGMKYRSYFSDGYDVLAMIYSWEELQYVSTYVARQGALQPYQPMGDAEVRILLAALLSYERVADVKTPVTQFVYNCEEETVFRRNERNIVFRAVCRSIGSPESNRYDKLSAEMRREVQQFRNSYLRVLEAHHIYLPDSAPMGYPISGIDIESAKTTYCLPTHMQADKDDIKDGFDFMVRLYSNYELQMMMLYCAPAVTDSLQSIAELPLSTLCKAYASCMELLANANDGKQCWEMAPQFSVDGHPRFRAREKSLYVEAIVRLIGKDDKLSFRSEATSLRSKIKESKVVCAEVSRNYVDYQDLSEEWEHQSRIVDHSLSYSQEEYDKDSGQWDKIFSIFTHEIFKTSLPLLYVWDTHRHLFPEQFQKALGIPGNVFKEFKKCSDKTIARMKADYYKFCTSNGLDNTVPLLDVLCVVEDIRSRRAQSNIPPSFVNIKLAYSPDTLVRMCRVYCSKRFDGKFRNVAFDESTDVKRAEKYFRSLCPEVLGYIYAIYKCSSAGNPYDVPMGLQCIFCLCSYSHFSTHCLRYLTREARKEQLKLLKRCTQCGRAKCEDFNKHKLGSFFCRFCVREGKEYHELTHEEKVASNHESCCCDSDRRWIPTSDKSKKPADFYTYMADMFCIAKATYEWTDEDWKLVMKTLKLTVSLNHQSPNCKKYMKLLPPVIAEDCSRRNDLNK